MTARDDVAPSARRGDAHGSRRQVRDGDASRARQLHAQIAPVNARAPAAPARPLVVFAPQFGNAAGDNVISQGATALRRRLEAAGCEVVDMTNRSGADLTAQLRERLGRHTGPVLMYVGGHGQHAQDFQAGHAHHTIAATNANGTERRVDTARDLIRPVFDALGPNAQLGVFLSTCMGGVAAENFQHALPPGAGGPNGRVAVVASAGPDQSAQTQQPVGLDPAETLLLQMATPASTTRRRADANRDGVVSAREFTRHANTDGGGLALASQGEHNTPLLPGPLSFGDPFSAATAAFLTATPTQNVTVTTQRVVAGGNLALPLVPNAPRDLPAHLPLGAAPTRAAQDHVARELQEGIAAQGVIPLARRNDASLDNVAWSEFTTNRGARFAGQSDGSYAVTNPNGTTLRVRAHDGHFFTDGDAPVPVRVDANGNVAAGAFVDAAARSYRPVTLNTTTGALERGALFTPPPAEP